jgi:hypothetical protein
LLVSHNKTSSLRGIYGEWEQPHVSRVVFGFSVRFSPSTDLLVADKIQSSTSVFLSNPPIIISPWIVAEVDLSSDGVIEKADISVVAKAFGSKLGDPDWNQAADLNEDEVINIVDITMVAIDFGKTV